MIQFRSHGDTALATHEIVNAQPARVRGFKGSSKGGSSGAVSNDGNTLRSRANFRLVEAVSEGPIWGLVDGHKSIYFDQTPLLNDDGTYNFKNLSIIAHKGLPDEGYFNGHTAVETPVNVEVQVKNSLGPTVRTIVDENVDAVRVIMRIPSLVHQDDKGGLKKTSVAYAIDVRANNGGWQQVIVNDLANQKTLSPVQIDHRVPLPLNGAPWDVRVRRLTADSTDDKLQNDTYWEGYVELVEGKFIYPNTAAFAISGTAEQMGSNIPPRSYHVRGLLVNVPSNYDPFTRQYTGIWDGTFKIAWTNNPAWVFYDLLVNDRYGLGEFIKPDIVDKWSLYTIAQYCDQLVKSGFKNGDTGADLYEPRYTFNGVINTKDEAFFVLQSITKAWRGMGYWALGQVFATADMPQDPVRLVTPANVIGGDFEYGGTALKARHSVIMVKWNNPDDFYRPDTEVVIDSELLHKYDWRDKTLQLTGCTSRGLAHRYGKWVIDTEQHETDTLTYQASWDHAELRPGEIIAVSNPRKALIRAGGRVVEHNGLTVTLDDDFEYTEGETYQLMLTLPSGQVETKPILAFLDARTIRLSSAFSAEAEPDAMWTIKGTDITPRLYRVISVDETDTNIFKITALFHDPQKYARIEKDIVFEPLPYDRPDKKAVPPTNLLVRETGYVTGGQTFHSLTVSWSPPPNTLLRGFIVAVDAPDGESFVIGSTNETFMELLTTKGGTYKFYVQTITYTGLTSEPATIEFEAAGPEGYPVPTVTDLELVDDPTTANFTGTDLRVRWKNNFALSAAGALEHVASPHYSHNTVNVYHNGTGALLRTERVTAESYTYDLASNRADCVKLGYATPTRAIRIEVTVTDVFARTSHEVDRVFTNPVPQALAPSYTVTASTIYLGFSQPTDPDYAGYVLLRSEVAGIDLTDDPYYDGQANPLTIPGEPNTTYYFRIAAYDAFGRTGLNWSTEFEISTHSDSVDFEPPAVPTGLAATSVIRGDGMVDVTYTWDANTEGDLMGYVVQIKEGMGNYVGFSAPSPALKVTVLPSTLLTAQVLAYDTSGNRSNFSDPPLVYTASRDELPPAVPSNWTAKGGFGLVVLSGDPNTELDFSHYEIYQSTTDTTPDASEPATLVASSNQFFVTDLDDELTLYFWLRSVDGSGNKSDWSDSLVATTVSSNVLLTTEALEGLIDRTSFATSIEPPGIGNTLPALPFTSATPKQFFLTTDGKMYIQKVDGSGWVLTTSTTILDGKIVTGQIAAGAIGADQIAAGAITTKNLSVRDFTILADNADMQLGAAVGWAGGASRIIQDATNAYPGQTWVAALTGTGTFVVTNVLEVPCVAGERFYLSAAVKTVGDAGSGRKGVRAQFIDKDGNLLTPGTADTTGNPTAWTAVAGFATAPADTAKVRLELINYNNVGGTTYVANPRLMRAAAVLIEPNGITADKLTTGELITLSAQIKDAIITSAKVLDLDAAKIRAGTIMAGTITVNGSQLGIIKNNAELGASDPATRINTGTTTINGGKVTISNTGVLSNWAMGGDSTEINGGAVAANTLTANKLTIGQRGINLENVQFSYDKATNIVSWTAGVLRYTRTNATTLQPEVGFVNILAGNATWTTGRLYVYWDKGATDPANGASVTLLASNVVATANGDNKLVLATYGGGTMFVANYGQTIIDGGTIRTQSIDTQQLKANAITASLIASDAIDTRHLKSQIITAKQMVMYDAQNWVANGEFEESDTEATWTFGGSNISPLFGGLDTNSMFYLSTEGSQTGRYVLALDRKSASYGTNLNVNMKNKFQVTSGSTLTVSVAFGSLNAASSAGFYITLYWYDSDGVQTTSTFLWNNSSIPATIAEQTKKVVVPAGATYCHLRITHGAGSTEPVIYVDRVSVRKANAASLIVDGGIKANHIDVDDLSALNIKVHNIDIDEGTIGGEKLTNGAISEVYVDSSGSSIYLNGSSNILVRNIAVKATERLLFTGFWNIRSFINYDSEITWFGYAQLVVNSTVIAQTMIVGPAVDGYTCSNQSISGACIIGSDQTVTCYFRFVIGSGGTPRSGSYNAGALAQNPMSNDSVSWSIMRAKK